METLTGGANIRANEYRGYHQFENEDGEKYGSFEVFWMESIQNAKDDFADRTEGWYWWPCFPGCMPESDANGPFVTSKDAYEDANDF